MAVSVGVVAAGAALFEAALLPGLLIGAAALLAPQLTDKTRPKSRSRRQFVRPEHETKRTAPILSLPGLRPFRIGQALGKTITFRLTMTSVDFAWNYIVLGELATAAGLSALNLAAGPVFYFLHEAGWNYLGASKRRLLSRLDLEILPASATGDATLILDWRGLKIDKALAKTIIYEFVSSSAEFTVNLLVVGDVVTAAIITAPVVILGPFLYYGHEKLWEFFTARAALSQQPAMEAA